MKWDDIVRKLTSRKFWVAIAEFVSMLLIAFGKSEQIAVQITGLIMAGAGVIAYIVGEGLADAAGAGTPVIQFPETEFTDEAKPPEENIHPV